MSQETKQPEVDAWKEYLEACDAAGDRYEAVETWAWDRLQTRLREMHAAALS